MYKIFSVVVIFFISTFSYAQDLKSGLLACAEESDNTKRLVCYDALAKANTIKPLAIQETSSATRLTTVKNTAQTTPEVFADDQPLAVEQVAPAAKQSPSLPTSAPKPEKPNLVAQATDTQTQPANTQTTAQVNSDAEERFGYEHTQAPKGMLENLRLPVAKVSKTAFGRLIVTLENGQVWRQSDKVRLKIKPGQNVTIARGVLGSFFMSTDQVKKSIRVKRVK